MCPPQRRAIVLVPVLLCAPAAWAQSAAHSTGREAPEVQPMVVEEDSDRDGSDDSLTDAQIEEIPRLDAEIGMARLRRRIASGEVSFGAPGPSVSRTGGVITIRMPPGGGSEGGSKSMSEAPARSKVQSTSKAKAKAKPKAGFWSSRTSKTAARAPSTSARSTQPVAARPPARRIPVKFSR